MLYPVIGFENRSYRNQKACRQVEAGIASAIPQIGDDLLHRRSRPSRAKNGREQLQQPGWRKILKRGTMHILASRSAYPRAAIKRECAEFLVLNIGSTVASGGYNDEYSCAFAS